MSELSDVTFDVICVTYNCDEPNKLETKIRKMFSYARLNIRVLNLVDTNRDFYIGSECIPQERLNDYFEFTGYYYGLKLLLNNGVVERCTKRNVVFMNDTIFNSHIESYFYLQLFKINNLIYEGRLNSPCIIGHPQEKYHGYIVPTCLFCVVGSDIELKNLKLLPADLFDDNELMSRSSIDTNNLFIKDKKVFDKAVDDWLRPKHFLRGWYKADFFNETSAQVFERKKVAIFLEHIFLITNRHSFPLVALGGFSIEFLKKIDQCYQFLLKLTHRALLLVKHLKNH